VTGTVADARELGIGSAVVPTVYACDSAPSPFPWYLARTSGDTGAAAAAVRRKIGELEPLRSVYQIAPLDQLIGDAYAQTRLRTVLLTFFAATALLLAALGVYGTLSYVVGLRRREIGLRVALGARHANIVSQFLFKALRVVGVGCVAGLGLVFVFTRSLASMLYGVAPTDVTTLVAVLAVVTCIAAAAALIPAKRAARLDPMEALRFE
jgi:putative ABC transport system permease protein